MDDLPSHEWLGYFQKHQLPGDVVLDPFCGCGTTIDAAEKLGRQWIGIDITQLAITLIKKRLQDTYGSRIQFVSGADGRAALPRGQADRQVSPTESLEMGSRTSTVHVIGEPTTPADAAKLAEEDKFQFQWWALGLVGARPEEHVRDLRGVLDREKAAIGILISLQPATGPMESEAASAGFYEHKTNKQKYPRLQLRTVKELMDGKGIERPTTAAALEETFKKAPESKKKHGEQKELI